MEKSLITRLCLFVCLSVILSTHIANAERFEFDNEKEIANWELGPEAIAKVKDGMLELTVGGGKDSGIYFGDPNWTDYVMEVRARKIVGPYFHLFVRVQKPTLDFYFMEISYNSNTTSLFQFAGGTGVEITPGGNPARPKRPESKDTKGGDAYTLTFEVKGETLKTFIDGKLMIEQKDKTYNKGRPGLGGRDSTVLYEYVDINGPGIKPSAVESTGKLAVTWGQLKK